MSRFFVYAFCRDDGSFYYIGKGSGRRAFSSRQKGIKPPSDKSKIIILHENLDEQTAFEYEKGLIRFYGRKDNGTGTLRNMTDGGEGVSGWIPSESWRQQKSESMKEDKNPFYGQKHSSDTIEKIKLKRKQTAERKRNESIDQSLKELFSEEKALKIYRAIQRAKRKKGIIPPQGRDGSKNPMFNAKREDLAEKNKRAPFNPELKWMNNGEIELRLLPSDKPEGFEFGRLSFPGNSRPVIVIDIQTGEERTFPSLTKAGIFLKISRSSLKRLITKERIIQEKFKVIFK